MQQRFVARQRYVFTNGAIGWRPGGMFDCLGPYAKVQNCPVEGSDRRYTCYATGYADTMFSIPACTRIRGKLVKGIFQYEGEDNIVFIPLKEKES